MRKKRFLALFGALAVLLVSFGLLRTIDPWKESPFFPFGEAEAADAGVDLDVPYVPTAEVVVDKMLEITRVKKTDMVYDLGCGDGRIVIAAAKRYGASGLGVDIDPERIRESNANAKAAGVTDRVKFLQKDLFTMDLQPATVMAMYLLPEVNLKLRPKMLKQLKPGTRVVSHDFDMGDWEPDQVVRVEGPDRTHTLYYWVIPAQVEGTWRVTSPGGRTSTLRLKQSFQEATGTMSAGGKSLPVKAKLSGNRISFTATDRAGGEEVTMKFEGTLNGDTLQGSSNTVGGPDHGRRKWTAKRAKSA